jgi:hypothetical protein
VSQNQKALALMSQKEDRAKRRLGYLKMGATFYRAPPYELCWRGQRDRERGLRDHRQCEHGAPPSRVARFHGA